MAMTNAQIKNATRKLVKAMFVDNNETAIFGFPDLKAAVQATDAVFDTQVGNFSPTTDDIETVFNKALPQPVKAMASPAQKALILVYTVMERFII
ncbi:MAG: hypothetical protein ACW98W_19605 [Candidatus Hodarchaeales archaeon]|jgi:hypothetical protein